MEGFPAVEADHVAGGRRQQTGQNISAGGVAEETAPDQQPGRRVRGRVAVFGVATELVHRAGEPGVEDQVDVDGLVLSRSDEHRGSAGGGRAGTDPVDVAGATGCPRSMVGERGRDTYFVRG